MTLIPTIRVWISYLVIYLLQTFPWHIHSLCSCLYPVSPPAVRMLHFHWYIVLICLSTVPIFSFLFSSVRYKPRVPFRLVNPHAIVSTVTDNVSWQVVDCMWPLPLPMWMLVRDLPECLSYDWWDFPGSNCKINLNDAIKTTLLILLHITIVPDLWFKFLIPSQLRWKAYCQTIRFCPSGTPPQLRAFFIKTIYLSSIVVPWTRPDHHAVCIFVDKNGTCKPAQGAASRLTLFRGLWIHAMDSGVMSSCLIRHMKTTSINGAMIWTGVMPKERCSDECPKHQLGSLWTPEKVVVTWR